VIPAIYALVKSRQTSPKKGVVGYPELKPAE
jgi:hypothetical protein